MYFSLFADPCKLCGPVIADNAGPQIRHSEIMCESLQIMRNTSEDNSMVHANYVQKQYLPANQIYGTATLLSSLSQHKPNDYSCKEVCKLKAVAGNTEPLTSSA